MKADSEPFCSQSSQSCILLEKLNRSRWIASVIAGNCGNCFTADVLKAHLTIINGKIDIAHSSDLLQAMCGKLLMKTSGRPVPTEIDLKLPLSGPHKQLVELLLVYVEAELCVEEEEAEELESIEEVLLNCPPEPAPTRARTAPVCADNTVNPYERAPYNRLAGAARSERTSGS